MPLGEIVICPRCKVTRKPEDIILDRTTWDWVCRDRAACEHSQMPREAWGPRVEANKEDLEVLNYSHLGAAILLQAYKDLTRDPKMVGLDIWTSAKNFLVGDLPEFRFWCSVAGMNPIMVQRQAQAALESNLRCNWQGGGSLKEYAVRAPKRNPDDED